ncbi:hypothetical protein F0562_022520 [Nyssa sinensis]|uniref:Uncharacterized protein n=1 Tax=Nyssa sinensis TaxID=561372 RepID=A0A5J5BQP3_9ASTE|nr:hypothetical protein F0562_022520 [Nyssa sinensis]
MGWLFTNSASSGQQALSGLVWLLPASTYGKQSYVLERYVVQSSDGAGAAVVGGDGATAGDCAVPPGTVIRNRAATMNALVVMVVGKV